MPLNRHQTLLLFIALTCAWVDSRAQASDDFQKDHSIQPTEHHATTEVALLPRYIEPMNRTDAYRAATAGRQSIDSSLMNERLTSFQSDSESRIVMHAPTGAEAVAVELTTWLQTHNAHGIENRIVDLKVSGNRVRYFHDQDLERAISIAELLGRVIDDLELQNFSHYRPAPTPGLVEIWVR